METIIICIEVFFARMIDVSIGSVRTILLVKGKNIISMILAFIEILIWFMVAKQTLTSDETNLAIILSYAVPACQGMVKKAIIEKLKEADYGVSTLSIEDGKLILLVEFKKKYLKKLKNTVRELDEDAFLIVNESLHVENGYIV